MPHDERQHEQLGAADDASVEVTRPTSPVGQPTEEPLVSVLVPIYNVERYLRQALESIRMQTFSQFEVVCINDGSTDGSRDIVQDFLDADPRFRVIDKPNSGYGASMNRGIQEARGRYIAILESDDFYDSDALRKLMTVALQLNADVVKGDYWFYWSEGRGRNVPARVIEGAMAGHLFNAWDEPQILLANPSVWSAVYKRSFLLGNGLKMLETPGASFQDLGFTFKVMASAERIYCIEDQVVHYRQDNEQSSVNNPAKVFCVCDEFDSIEDFLDAVPARKVLRPYLFRLRYDSYMWNFERLAPQLRGQFLETMVGDLQRGMRYGEFVPSLFEGYQRANLEFMLEEPQEFLKLFPQKPTRMAKLRYYRKIGGVRGLLG